MPQFDLANFVPQLAWLTIFFAILYFGIVGLTLPKLGKVMTAREDKVSGDIATAESAKAEADRIEEAYASDIAAAQDKARASLAETRAKVARSIETKLAKAGAKVDARNQEAQAALDTARTSALASIETIAADAAADIVERLTGGRPDATAAAQAARTAMAQEG
jgi:F-type H+-transporting ATPase subunit b